MGSSREGSCWTPEEGWIFGLQTEGAISPKEYYSAESFEAGEFDIIVIGAGYAGLVASRDLALQGFKVLLLEARDRIGGRTWTAKIDGFPYEMGAQWVHWHQPNLYREISLYGLNDKLRPTETRGGKSNYFSLTIDGTTKNITHEEENEYFLKLWKLFCDVDGEALKTIIPYPFDPLSHHEKVKHWDKLSVRDRLDQIKNDMTHEEMAFFWAVLHQLSGSPLEEMSFLDALQWWALGDYHASGLNNYGLKYELSQGQSHLSRQIFDHGISTDHLSYSFDSPVASICEANDVITTTLRDGRVWKSRSVVCTVPLNVLPEIEFSPELSQNKFDAIREGHTNRGNKVHVETPGPDLVSWAGFANPGEGFTSALGNHLTPRGSTHLAVFGPNVEAGGIDLKEHNIDKILEAFAGLKTTNVNRVLFHDWANDEFSKGTWSFYRPKYATKYLGALQKPHLNTHFASADWADGWRGWLDGAIQQGARKAHLVAEELKNRNRIATPTFESGVLSAYEWVEKSE